MRFAFLISILAASAAGAQDGGAVSAPPGPECFCTDRAGARVELGQTICLQVDGRAFLALCDMSLNSPMWRDTGSECVGAGLVRAAARVRS